MKKTHPRGLSSSSRRRALSVAIVWLLAIACAFSPASVQAKHATLNDAPPDETPDASAPSQAQSGKATVIRGEIVEVHDRLAPAEQSGIKRSHSFTITFSGKNHVSETWLESGGAPILDRRKRYSGGGFRVFQDEDSVTIGSNTEHVVWHVLSERKLQRLFSGQHFLMMMDIEIDAGKACHVEARYLKETGFDSIVMERRDSMAPGVTGTMANFSLPRVESASCSIE